jgi:predicted ester cyclase
VEQVDPDTLRHLYERVIAAFAEGDANGLDELLDERILDHNPLPDQAAGRDGFKQWLAQARSAFPDLSANVEDVVVEGDRVAGRVTYRGTHSGAFVGVAATGHIVEFRGLPHCAGGSRQSRRVVGDR